MTSRRRRLLAAFLAVGIASGSGCASFSNRTKTLLAMGGAAVAAGIVGAAIAPEGDSRAMHAALWEGGAGALTGAAGLFIFDEEARSREEKARAERLQKALSSCSDGPAPKLMATNQIGLEKPLPSRFRNLITPGEWSLYRVDRWVNATDSEMVHQDLIFRFSQPQLNPSARTESVPAESNGGTNEKEK